MVRKPRAGTLLLTGLMLCGAARLVWAGEQAPAVTGTEAAQVWGSVYKVSALVRSERGLIQAAQYRVGSEVGSMFAADGLLDSREELVETYIDIPAGQEVAVRARTAGGWSDWLVVESAGSGPAGAAGCTMSSAESGSEGWYRSDVTVDCGPLIRSEGAERVEYSLNFSDWAEAEQGFAVTEEGVHWVQVRSVTADGVAGLPSTFTVAIDKTAPRLFLQNPPAPRMSHADTLELDFAAEDELSGVEAVVVDMNTELEIMQGVPVELWQLPLGRHSLTVYARDRAGNVATSDQSVELEITVDTADLAKLVQLFSGRGRLDAYTGLKGRLLSFVELADASVAAQDVASARWHLAAFVDAVAQGMAEGLIFEDEGRVLSDDATWIMEHLADDQTVAPPDWAFD